MKFDAILFDFDGVLLESEYAGNRQIAEYLSGIGHPTTPEESMANFMGLAGGDFFAAIERWIGRAIPDDFHAAREIEDRRAIEEGIAEVAGAVLSSARSRRSYPAPSPRRVRRDGSLAISIIWASAARSASISIAAAST